uniref:Uncharacterized protein n=1 Tax=viral metagenome TaxID=1070528 RepID=A0A6C0CPB8_9ZZZZ
MSLFSDSMKRRLHRELDKYSPIFLEDYNRVIFSYFNKVVSVLLDEKYPFYCPIIILNNEIMSYTSQKFPNRLLTEYVEKNGCPCCSSMTCPDNWSPALGIINILEEYDTFINKLKMYQKIRMTKRLKIPDDMIGIIISFLTI